MINSHSLGIKVGPKKMRGTTKYGTKGNCSRDSLATLELPESTRENLAAWANMGLSKKTWSSYKTAERMFLTCLKQKGKRLQLPVSNADILVFIDWLGTDRKLRSSTIENYLAGLRQMHICKGIDPPDMHSVLVKQVLKGLKNKNLLDDRTKRKPQRLPMTKSIMLLLKELIRTWEETTPVRIMTWSICTLAFAGSFRIHELLCRTEKVYDPDFDLLWEDITKTAPKDHTDRKRISIKLKCPKENKTGKSTIVDVFETKDHLCPVRAFEKWESLARTQERNPVFLRKDGKLMTGQKLNEVLRKLLRPHLDYKEGQITTHSFRAGIASLLAEKGLSDEEIKSVGRWHSRAFEAYVKKPRTRRATLAKTLAEF